MNTTLEACLSLLTYDDSIAEIRRAGSQYMVRFTNVGRYTVRQLINVDDPRSPAALSWDRVSAAIVRSTIRRHQSRPGYTVVTNPLSR